MKLYIRQKVFSWVDKFYVKDECGRDKYYVEGELFSWGKKLHVYDMQGAEVAYIHQKVWSWRLRYEVFSMGRQIAEIVKEFTFLRPRYTINGMGWKVDGSFWGHDYEITDSRGFSVVTIAKEWMTWGDCYELSIARPEDEIAALAVVLGIDCAVDSEQAAAASGGSH